MFLVGSFSSLFVESFVRWLCVCFAVDVVSSSKSILLTMADGELLVFVPVIRSSSFGVNNDLTFVPLHSLAQLHTLNFST